MNHNEYFKLMFFLVFLFGDLKAEIHAADNQSHWLAGFQMICGLIGFFYFAGQ